jgi:WD40 repeat protein
LVGHRDNLWYHLFSKRIHDTQSFHLPDKPNPGVRRECDATREGYISSCDKESFIDHTLMIDVQIERLKTETRTFMGDAFATYSLLYSPAKNIECSQAHRAGPLCINFSPNGNYLASGGGDGILAIWSLSTSKPHYTFRGDVAITCVKWSSQNTILFGREDGTVCCGEIRKVRFFVLSQSLEAA